MRYSRLFFLTLISGLLLVTGCTKKNEADPAKPLTQVREESQSLTKDELKNVLQSYVDAIVTRKDQVQQIQSKLKDTAVGAETTKMRAELVKIASEVQALQERYSVYAVEFQKKGGNVAEVQLPGVR